MMPFLALIVAYLVGGIPFGYLLVRMKTGQDVRSMGSGNIGATNVLRTTGRAIAVITLLLDIGKGFFAVWLTQKLCENLPPRESALWMSAAALAVMAGHAYPVFLKFQGGKAVASFIGAFAYLTPIPMAVVLVLFVIVVAATRHISMGSIVAAGSLPLAVWLVEHPPAPVWIAAAAAGFFIIYRHGANIARIRAGNENVFRFK
ncbi:MAG TPA: glycerol-3-phosphate 1-O-acyltransferase PlsY [Bryobacteraceae bacterium]|nr:glycerol-3-phosphate 1-O-acyltransferase PlsY [Bryobacteraceae bacterium]